MKLLPLLLALILLPGLLRAQGATGTLEGRVQNPANGTYLEGARVSVEGTALTAFTAANLPALHTNGPTMVPS